MWTCLARRHFQGASSRDGKATSAQEPRSYWHPQHQVQPSDEPEKRRRHGRALANVSRCVGWLGLGPSRHSTSTPADDAPGKQANDWAGTDHSYKPDVRALWRLVNVVRETVHAYDDQGGVPRKGSEERTDDRSEARPEDLLEGSGHKRIMTLRLPGICDNHVPSPGSGDIHAWLPQR